MVLLLLVLFEEQMRNSKVFSETELYLIWIDYFCHTFP